MNNKTGVRALHGDPEAIDFPAVCKALKAIRFDGFLTLMTDAIPVIDSRDLSRRYVEFFKPLL
ncbi:MAG: hypothetical protein EXS18_04675 [Verrucomicrobiae bacterium]|nr:hypothetical protein [Verrucomicrobiae bacterium]